MPIYHTSFGIKTPISFTVREDIKYDKKNVITYDKFYSGVFTTKYDVILALLLFTEYRAHRVLNFIKILLNLLYFD